DHVVVHRDRRELFALRASRSRTTRQGTILLATSSRSASLYRRTNMMKRILIGSFAAALYLGLGTGPGMVRSAHAENMRQEMKGHPRIAKAIRELEDAIAYMRAAPHDFGGHKAAALQASEAALQQLRLALA